MTRDENIHYCVTHNFIDTLNEWNEGTDLELEILVIEAVKKVRLKEMTVNYLIKTKSFVFNDLSYSLSQTTISDVIGLIVLEQDSNIGVRNSEGEDFLVMHSLQDLKVLLNSIRLYLTNVKTIRYNKVLQLKALTTIDQIEVFDITV